MAAPSVATASIDRKSSIETEPRTLDIQQIQFAREAALYVMSTKTIEEALQIFTEGLEPVVNPVESVEAQNNLIPIEIWESDSESESEEDEHTVCTSVHKRQFRVEKLRDVLTAPF